MISISRVRSHRMKSVWARALSWISSTRSTFGAYERSSSSDSSSPGRSSSAGWVLTNSSGGSGRFLSSSTALRLKSRLSSAWVSGPNAPARSKSSTGFSGSPGKVPRPSASQAVARPPGSVTTGWNSIVTAPSSISWRILVAPAMKCRLSGAVWITVPSASGQSSTTNSRETRNSKSPT